jgi:coenzyme PQQ synthesis protein D (PqqD)
MTAKAPTGTRPLRRSGLWARQTGGENALYDPATEAVHLLNETAWAIWDLCDGETSPDEMIEAICEISRMHREVVSEDVSRILAQFDEAGLVSWVQE